MLLELEVAARLTKLRLDSGYSKSDVARAIGVSPATYSKYEIGQGKMRVRHIERLSLLYHVSCDYIACRDIDLDALPDGKNNRRMS